MKKSQVQPKFIKELKKTPVVTVACEKVGICRQTVYRWMKEDDEFLEKVKEAMKEGVSLVNDVAESNVLKGIKQGDVGYTKFWLSHKNESFRKPHRHRDAQLDFLTFKLLEQYSSTDARLDPYSEAKKQAAKARVREMLDKWKPFFPEEPPKGKKKKK